MALWTIQRIETNPTGGDIGLDCVSPQEPWRITLRDTDTGDTSVVTACVNPAVAPCDHDSGVLYVLTQAGYAPADWDDECAP